MVPSLIFLSETTRPGALIFGMNICTNGPLYMRHDLVWLTFEERRGRLRLTMLFKFQHGLTDVVPGHILRPISRRRGTLDL